MMRVLLGSATVICLFACDALFGEDEELTPRGEDVLVIAMADVFVMDTLGSIGLQFIGADVTFRATQTDGQTAFLRGLLDEGGKIGGIGGLFEMYAGQELVLSLEVHSGEIPSSAGGGLYAPEDWEILASANARLPYARLDEIWYQGQYLWDPTVDFILRRR